TAIRFGHQFAGAALAGKYDGYAKDTRHGHGEEVAGRVEGMHQADPVASQIAAHLQGGAQQYDRFSEGVDRKGNHWDARGAQFFIADSVGTETGDMRCEARLIQGAGDFSEMMFAAALRESLAYE